MDRENDNYIRETATKLSQLLVIAGATAFRMHYTGEGDSTDGFTCETEPETAQAAIAELKIQRMRMDQRWDSATSKWIREPKQAEESFEDVVYDLAEELWNRAGQSGWYNNEGGYGDITILPGGFVEFRHVNYDNESYDDEENGVDDEDRATTEACHWRFNTLVGPIDAPYAETAPA